MKSLVTVLFAFLCVTACYSQNYIGGNGEGLTEKYFPADITLIDSLGTIGIAFPGGASAKYCEATLQRPGLGMQRATIVAFNTTYGTDENGNNNLTNDLRDLSIDSTEDRSYLYDLRDIQQSTGCKIIWKVNIFVSPSVVIKSVQDFQSIGGVVNGFAMGNELYFVFDFDGAKYVSMCSPIIDALHSSFPSIPIAMCFAQDVSSKGTHMKFNNSVISYINSNRDKVKAVDTHPYLSGELGSAKLLHPANPVNPADKKDVIPIAYSSSFNSQLSSAFDEYNRLWQSTNYYNACFDTINARMPGVEIWTSEWGTIPVNLWGNTISNGAYIFDTYLKYSPRVKYFLAHNLLGNFYWAFIYNHTTHIQYYSLQYANDLLGKQYQELTDLTSDISLQSSGTYYYKFVNLTGSPYDFTVTLPEGFQYTVSVHEAWGGYNYSTLGEAGFYKKNPPVISEVSTISNGLTQTINGYSFGYVTVTVTGSPVCRCTDPTASNYNQIVPCSDTTPCEYKPVTECRRKFFGIFCLKVKRNCNC